MLARRDLVLVLYACDTNTKQTRRRQIEPAYCRPTIPGRFGGLARQITVKLQGRDRFW